MIPSAIPYIKQSVTSFKLKPRFISSIVHVAFVVDKVAMALSSFPSTTVFLYQLKLHQHSTFIYHPLKQAPVRPQDQGNLSHPAPPITMSWVSDHIRI
jgi:hypothetical protein